MYFVTKRRDMSNIYSRTSSKYSILTFFGLTVYNCGVRQQKKKKTNLNKIQAYQNITLRKITNVPPPYVSNQTLHDDLNMKTTEEEPALSYKRFVSRLGNRGNPLVKKLNSLTLPENPRRRLKRRR